MINKKTFEKFARDPSAFRDSLLVDADGSAREFGSIMDDWQREDFQSIDSALQRCIGRTTEETLTRFYFERARGHSKTTDLAVVAVYALVFRRSKKQKI